MDTQQIETTQTQSVIDQLASMGHEQVVHCYDEATGLKAIIGIHNTTLGPALGGTRMWMYNSDSDALKDVLRLSRGMTFKASIAGLNLGGGKAVIIGDAKTQKNEALLRKFGRFVNSLSGKYITAEDVGMSARDMEYISMETKHVTGLPGASGDPSPVTAFTTYMGMKAAAKKAYGNDSLEGKVIALQGVGHVGEYLLQHVLKEGAKVYVSEYYEDHLKEICNKYKVTGVSLDEIYDVKMDIYAPCALGATVNDDTLNRLNCQIIAGAANNQLATENIHGPACQNRGILYAPDFLINSGGLMNVYSELHGYNKDKVMGQAETIYDLTSEIFQISEQENIHTQQAAIQMAQKRIDDMGKVKMMYSNNS